MADKTNELNQEILSQKKPSKNTMAGIMTYEQANQLISLPEEEYNPPFLPFNLPKFDAKVELGSDEMRSHFYIDFQNWAFMNHGGFGGTLKAAVDTVNQIQIHVEKQPLRFIDRELLPHMVFAIRKLAGFVSCDPRDLVLVSNATEGLNTVIRSLRLGKGDKVYYLNLRYYAVNMLFTHLKREDGIEIKEISLNLPFTKDELLNTITKTLDPDTKLAVFDHIPSAHPIILPVKEIIDICHQKGIPVLIDGAHALGTVPLNLKTLNADYYVINCHKWLCNAKGCGALYVDKKHQSSIRCLTVSSGFGQGFTADFIFRGLKDYSPFLALHTVLEFWNTFGMARIQSHNTVLAHKAAKMLSENWQTDTLFPIDMYGPMVLVRLPDILWQSQMTDAQDSVSKANAEFVQNKLHYNYGIEVPIKPIIGRLYARISAHVYNKMEDYDAFKEAVRALAEQCSSKNLE